MTYGDGGLLRSPTTTVLECIYVFMSSEYVLMKMCALMLGAYSLIMVISFWCIFSLISMECPLSHLINVSLKSTWSEMSIATLFCFGGPLTW
jgi:hypothetical protein